MTGTGAAPVIETARLTLRPWRAADRMVHLALSVDPAVSAWLGGTPTRQAVAAAFEALLQPPDDPAHRRWALVRQADTAVVGAISLDRVSGAGGHPLAGSVEVGWRLFPTAWGSGYASEGAAAALDWGFANLDVAEIVAFTAASNARSEAVMCRLGLVRDAGRDFEHPALAPGHPLRPHVVYVAHRPD